MNEIKEMQKAYVEIVSAINTAFARLIRIHNGEEAPDLPTTEYAYPLTVDTNIFIGKKPAAVLFGEERVDVKTWREVCAVVLKRCNESPEHHEMLMCPRNKTARRCRVFLSDSPDGMSSPLRIDEDMYGETHYGSATLMHILIERILKPAGFDFSDISIVLKT